MIYLYVCNFFFHFNPLLCWVPKCQANSQLVLIAWVSDAENDQPKKMVLYRKHNAKH